MRFPARVLTALTALGLLVACGSTTGTGHGSTGTTSAGATTTSGTGGAATSTGAGATSAGTGGATSASTASTGGTATCGGAGTYDQTVLCDHPVAFWTMSHPSGSEPDRTGNGNTGTYMGGVPTLTTLPNGDQAADFDGASQYLTVPSKASFSIPTTGTLTWEGWIRPDVLQFPHDDGNSGYVDWMGKCEQYGPTCEWEARMYDLTTQETPNRPNRLSAYVFNPSAGLGSAADWQPMPGVIQVSQWYHVVGEYTTLSQPSDCPDVPVSPGAIDIWVNGVAWSQSSHDPTGCMSQYNVVPKANGSALNIGTMALDTWFKGAVGKVAVYDYLLSPTQITAHYQGMTGKSPAGSCADSCTL